MFDNEEVDNKRYTRMQRRNIKRRNSKKRKWIVLDVISDLCSDILFFVELKDT